MRLRLLARADLEAVRQLRNQHREFFFDTREITTDQQQAWFEDLGQKPIAFYVIEQDGRVVGTISVTDGSDGREIGNLVLDPAYRGQGLMREAVDQLTAAAASYFADVKRGNRPSLNVFRSAGFGDESAEEATIRLRKRVR